MNRVVIASPGFLTLLGLLFIGLKLGSVISWSWWWVLLPLYWPAAFLFGSVAVVLSLVSIFLMTGALRIRK